MAINWEEEKEQFKEELWEEILEKFKEVGITEVSSDTPLSLVQLSIKMVIEDLAEHLPFNLPDEEYPDLATVGELLHYSLACYVCDEFLHGPLHILSAADQKLLLSSPSHFHRASAFEKAHLAFEEPENADRATQVILKYLAEKYPGEHLAVKRLLMWHRLKGENNQSALNAVETEITAEERSLMRSGIQLLIQNFPSSPKARELASHLADLEENLPRLDVLPSAPRMRR